MRKFLRSLCSVASAALACMAPSGSKAQGIHFSQYYNAPMLLNPANTALMPDKDYRVGMNYRNQWSSLPVPYNTFSLYGDAQLFHNSDESNWLGLGAAFFNDRAGDGGLSLNRGEVFLAYHIQMGYTSMLSLGLSAATVTRSVDFGKLTFDRQWDGRTFNSTLANGETPTMKKTSYNDYCAGLNYAYFPNESVYIKFGAGLAHLNQPTESFYGQANQLGLRPTGNVDALLQVNPTFILNPSIYYTSQRGAMQLVYGSLFDFYMGGDNRRYDDRPGSHFILGAYHRLGDAAIAVVGYAWGGFRFMSSYDITISQLSPYNQSRGALELSLRWEGIYPSTGGMRKGSYNCPRF